MPAGYNWVSDLERRYTSLRRWRELEKDLDRVAGVAGEAADASASGGGSGGGDRHQLADEAWLPSEVGY